MCIYNVGLGDHGGLFSFNIIIIYAYMDVLKVQPKKRNGGASHSTKEPSLILRHYMTSGFWLMLCKAPSDLFNTPCIIFYVSTDAILNMYILHPKYRRSRSQTLFGFVFVFCF